VEDVEDVLAVVGDDGDTQQAAIRESQYRISLNVRR